MIKVTPTGRYKADKCNMDWSFYRYRVYREESISFLGLLTWARWNAMAGWGFDDLDMARVALKGAEVDDPLGLVQKAEEQQLPIFWPEEQGR